MIGAWIGARPRAEVVAAFAAARVSLASIDSPTEVVRNPHFRARGSLLEVEDEGGQWTMAAPFPARAQDAGRIRWLGRELGVDNHAIYRDWLGLSSQELSGSAPPG